MDDHCSGEGFSELLNGKEETFLCVCADLEGVKPVLQARGGRARGDAPPLSRMPIGQPQVTECGGRGLNQTGGTGGERNRDVSNCCSHFQASV